ncbi:MAG: hypothetical protein ACK55I_50900, partial [bacterium]
MISALQVAKHPIAAPGPSSVFTPPAFRHATLPGLCNSIFYFFTFREVLSRRAYQSSVFTPPAFRHATLPGLWLIFLQRKSERSKGNVVFVPVETF